ncbi:MAG: hypothetical protein K0Q67_2199 [Cellvibrio sp.]|jgi:hypothetical protein|nr:hypothetical protein [Cellvibrio sp.]
MNRGLVLVLVNAVVFQLGWFVCILGGSVQAAVFTGLAVVIHLLVSRRWLDDCIAIILALLLGLVHDLILIHTGQIRFVESAQLPPVWLVCLWALLGITLNHSLKWIYSRPLWSSLLGAIAAPLSYFAGVALSSAEWSSPLVEVLPIIAVLWLMILPFHRFLSLRISSYVQHQTTQ